MNKSTQAACITALGLALAFPIQAGQGYSVEDRLAWQQKRIDQGLASGALSRREARSLQQDQREIRSLIRDLRRDGWLSRDERRLVDQRLDEATQRIRDMERNGGRRDSYRDRLAEDRHESHGQDHHWNW
jgi:hypothetical protein